MADGEADGEHLLHRDDLPMDEAEALVNHLRERHPDMRVVFAGDVPTDRLPAEVRDAARLVEAAFERSMTEGTCLDCGAAMPGYPPPGGPMPDDWQPAAGWCHYTMRTGNLIAWQCPACDALDAADGEGD